MGIKFHAYGWVGHLICKEELAENDCTQLNIIPISKYIFERINNDFDNCKLPEGVQAQSIGYSQHDDHSIAIGWGFTNAWYQGRPFDMAELLVEGKTLAVKEDEIYRQVMKEHYGLELPKSRIMVGVETDYCG